jgi:hypothetical protein
MIQIAIGVCVSRPHGTIDLTQGLGGVFRFPKWWVVGNDMFKFTNFMFKPLSTLGLLQSY